VKTKQTDNSNLQAKLVLRRYFLKKYHPDGGLVFDCCQAEKTLWSLLLPEFPAMTYFGLDKKPRQGRLSVDSARIIGSIPNIDVYDVDTYGDPVAHFVRICETIEAPVTVFLTWGINRAGGGLNISKECRKASQIPPKTPPGLVARALPLIQEKCCSLPVQYDIIIREAMEAPRATNCWYFGMRLEPQHGEQNNG